MGKPKTEFWINMFVPLIASWIIFVVVIIMITTISNPYYLFLIPSGLIVFLVIALRWLSEPNIDLGFHSYIEPHGHTVNLNKNEGFQLVWEFTNFLNKEIKILSYNIRINSLDDVFRNFNWRYNYQPTIPPNKNNPEIKIWGKKGKGGYGIENSGVYEFQSIVEYQLPNKEKKMAYHSCQLKVIGMAKPNV